MTDKEAKAILIDKVKPCLNGTEWEMALDIAIKALEQEPCEDATLKDIFCMGCEYKEQEPCEDAISRQAVLDGLASIAKAKAKSDAQKSLIGRIMFFTEHLPSVNPQEPILDKIRAEIHATAEMHEDGDYYLRDEWIDEIIDKYKAESDG